MRKILLGAILLSLIAFNAYAADQWDKAKPAGTDSPSTIDDNIQINNNALDRLLSNYKRCKITYASSSTVTVSIGEAVCSNSGGSVRRFRANTSATTVTWADIDTGSEATSTTYYVYAVADTDATTFTCKISTSASSPTGCTYYKRLGSFYNDASGDIYIVISNDDNLATASSYDSGWFAVALNTSYTKTHGLGTNKLLVQVWYSASSDGSSAELMYMNFNSGGGQSAGCWTNTLTTTTLRVNTGTTDLTSRGYNGITWGGSIPAVATSGYYRVVALAFE